MQAPLSDEELKRIEALSDTRFDCQYWRLSNLKQTIKRLLAHISYLKQERT